MAIQIPQGFKITSRQSIDDRIVLTKSEMLNMIEGRMPDNYICVCKDDGKLYIYNKNNEPDPVYGLFKPYEEVIDIPGAIKSSMSSAAGKEAMAEAIAETLPGAMEDVMKDSESAQELVDAMFDSEQFAVNVDNKIELAISTIEAIDGMA